MLEEVWFEPQQEPEIYLFSKAIIWLHSLYNLLISGSWSLYSQA